MSCHGISRKAYEAAVEGFLKEQQDIHAGDHSYYTDRDFAAITTSKLHQYLFKEGMDKDERRQQYLRLKEEFGAE